MTAPTTAPGYVDDSGWMGNVSASDTLENVADLMWPASVTTYGHMRRDPQLAAVLASVTLPIRRATWAVDPDGCDPGDVQLVAEGLGLPVLGAARAKTGARVRGVRWPDHLRMGLTGRLVWGHMPFAERYDVTTGKAKLAELPERMPSTIAEIEVDDGGALKGITQHGTPGRDTPTIRASQLLWYVHEREGSAWQGTSLLRPAFAPWLLKREMLRVHATSNRRFGMGIPVARALPGTNPTPGQIVEAQRLASAARVGDQAGVGMPPGFELQLVGLTGKVPDTVAFIRYLDQQMSRMALAGALDLGETPNGSRALGAEFVDLFLLSVQAVADDHASQHTAQTAARIVEYNSGLDATIPEVVVADVGSKREVTAEALQVLLASGAVGPDPALERWVRSEWRLPLREQMPAASLPGPAAGAGPRPRRKRSARTADAAQTALPHPGLPPGATTDVERLDGDLSAAETALLAGWAEQVEPVWRAEVAEQVAAAVESGDAGGLADLAVTTAAGSALLAAALLALAAFGVAAAVAEAAGQGVDVDGGDVGGYDDWLESLAQTVTTTAASGYAAAAGREASRIWQPALTDSLPAAERAVAAEAVAERVAEHLDGLSGAWLADQIGGALHAAQQGGRVAVLDAAPAAAYFASEVRDRNTCGPCRDVDGTEFASLADARAAYPTGGYVDCAGRLRCRGGIVAVWKQPADA